MQTGETLYDRKLFEMTGEQDHFDSGMFIDGYFFHFSGLLALVALTDFVIYIYCQTLPITLCVLWHALH